MIQNKTQSTKKEALLTTQDTQCVINEIASCCIKLDFMGLIEIITKYPPKNLTPDDFSEFVAKAKEKHHFWQENPLVLEIKSVNTFESKCIACSFGKKVKAFNVQFLKLKDAKLPGRIVYKISFAINFDIKDNEIIDIGWCNAFLEEKEIVEFQN